MKTSFLLFITMLLSSALGAQEKGWAVGGYGFIGNAGFGYPTVDSKGNAGPAYQFGAVAQYHFGGFLALRTGLIYSLAKGSVSGNEPDVIYPGFPTLYGDRYEAKFRHTDLLVPLEFVADLGKKRDQGVYALLGTAFGIALNWQATQSVYSSGTGWSTRQLSDNHPPVSVYGTIGLGYVFRLNSGTRLFAQLSGTSNAASNLILSLMEWGKQSQTDHAQVNWYGLGVGVKQSI